MNSVSQIGHRQADQFVTALEKAGLSPELASKVTEGEKGRDLAEKMVNVAIFGESDPIIGEPMEHQMAREIMGDNFFGIPEIFKAWRAYPPKSDWEPREEDGLPERVAIEWERKTLEECRNTHILILCADESYDGTDLNIENMTRIFLKRNGLSAKKIREIMPAYEGIQNDVGELNFSWRLIDKNISPFNPLKDWDGAYGRLKSDSDKYYIATLNTHFYIIYTCYLVRKMRLLENDEVCTRTGQHQNDEEGWLYRIGLFQNLLPAVKQTSYKCPSLGVLLGKKTGKRLKPHGTM